MGKTFQVSNVTLLDNLITCHALRNLVPSVQFEKREKNPGELLFLVKLQASVCNSTKSNTSPWVLFHVFHIVQIVPNHAKRFI